MEMKDRTDGELQNSAHVELNEALWAIDRARNCVMEIVRRNSVGRNVLLYIYAHGILEQVYVTMAGAKQLYNNMCHSLEDKTDDEKAN
jgi:hypothetical protein